LPTIKGLPAYSESLTEEDRDNIWVSVLNFFMDLNLVNMVNKVQSKIKSAKNIVFDILKLKALLNENNFEEFLAQSKELYERSKSQDILDLIVSHLLAHPSEET
jgi:hypothetical protein